MSLIQAGKILELFYSTDNGRVNTTELALDDKGVIEDKYYNKDIQRSVLITSLDSYKLAASNGIDAPYSALGENILMDYNPYHLRPGARLTIGDLELEISQNCTLCKSLAKIDAKLPKLLKDDRGVFAKVIRSGTIRKDDNIYLLK
ncbi:MAG: MOSC domain-containing protein [Sulfurimonas sp.]|uniref:MOSC domain-containing protein n=1 Tax=Sulfurimonas sp. TaxID=2022749 RepID=UPI0025E19791|nr:MOSC domain-containing protein [Sulfurimonas sp.]MCK9490688.1 MOSC domain-containing protein [Sulfurimonas sp.]